MQWNSAGFHVGRHLQVPDDVTVVTLLAYSPELNTIESLWHYIKSHYWSKRAYNDYDALEQAPFPVYKKSRPRRRTYVNRLRRALL